MPAKVHRVTKRDKNGTNGKRAAAAAGSSVLVSAPSKGNGRNGGGTSAPAVEIPRLALEVRIPKDLEGLVVAFPSVSEEGFQRAFLITRPLTQINDAGALFPRINGLMSPGDRLIYRFEELHQRKRRLRKAYSRLPGRVVDLGDFLLHRVLPKLSLTRTVHRALFPKAENSPMSLCDALGCAAFAGMEVESYEEGEEYFTVQVRKNGSVPVERPPRAGLLFTQQRMGKGGRKVLVYKLRTMHQYAQYLQNYIIDNHGLNGHGKVARDFRIADWGRVLRRYWLDEIPQLLNVIRGELKLVGVRPLSEDFFQRYPRDLQEKRSRWKPGCIPPFYYDMPKNFEEIIESERRYLESYERHPLLTDLRYFLKSMYNIIVRKARSR
ncbi:MAG TPA: hypothetical protein ENI92_04560 [Bacteroidetes bacterium]|nr:hypothetical protein [Bacteroidota bacterium]